MRSLWRDLGIDVPRTALVGLPELFPYRALHWSGDRIVEIDYPDGQIHLHDLDFQIDLEEGYARVNGNQPVLILVQEHQEGEWITIKDNKDANI